MAHLPDLQPVGSGDGYEDAPTLRSLFALALCRFTDWNEDQIDKILQELGDPQCEDPRREDLPLASGALECLSAGLIPDNDQLLALALCIGIEVTITQTPSGLIKYEFQRI